MRKCKLSGQSTVCEASLYTPALADLNLILDYIAAKSPQVARHVQARLKDMIELLTRHPAVGTRTSDPLIRRMVATPYPYLIFYEVTAAEIIIHAVRHAGRDPSKMPGF